MDNNSKINLIVIQATPFCNIDCSYCYLPDRLSKKRISDQTLLKIFQKTLTEDFITDKTSIVWHAGEPLVLPISFYQNAFSILGRENKTEFKVKNHFQTNGTLLNQNWCDFIRENDIKIGVSIDGPEHIHNRTRIDRSGKGTFDKVMKGIHLLQENKIPFHVIAVLSNYSLDYPDEIFNFFADNGIVSFAFNVEEQEGINVNSSLNNDDSTEKRFREFFAKLLKLQDKSSETVRIREISHLKNSIIHSSDGDIKADTNTPYRILNFDCDGNFSTFSPELLTMNHEKYGNFIFGNIHNNELLDMLSNEKFIQIHKDIQNGIEKCKNECEFFSLCGGGPPVNKLCENQSFDSTETNYCKLQIKAASDITLNFLEEKLQIN